MSTHEVIIDNIEIESIFETYINWNISNARELFRKIKWREQLYKHVFIQYLKENKIDDLDTLLFILDVFREQSVKSIANIAGEQYMDVDNYVLYIQETHMCWNVSTAKQYIQELLLLEPKKWRNAFLNIAKQLYLESEIKFVYKQIVELIEKFINAA